MDGFAVTAAEVQRLAEAGAAVAEAIRAADVAGPVAQLTVALPGGTTAAESPAIAQRWAAGFAGLADWLAHHNDNLGLSAQAYAGVEDSIAAALAHPPPPPASTPPAAMPPAPAVVVPPEPPVAVSAPGGAPAPASCSGQAPSPSRHRAR